MLHRRQSYTYGLCLVLALAALPVTAAAGWAPGNGIGGNNPFGMMRMDLPPLPSLPGRQRTPSALADAMSEALDELRETRVELTALREDVRSMHERMGNGNAAQGKRGAEKATSDETKGKLISN